MTWIFILAGFMAIFGVIGYLRGTRAALFILIMAIIGVAITGALGDVTLKTHGDSTCRFDAFQQ